jgi:hypothetical protein
VSQRAVVDEPAFIYDWEGGVSTADMATRYGISDSTVSKVARRMGLPGRRGPTAGVRPPTHPAYALTGGRWVPAGGVMRWQRTAAPGA